MNQPKKLADVKIGDYVRLADTPDAPVWIRDAYDRADKKFVLSSTNDISKSISRKGKTIVFVGFTY